MKLLFDHHLSRKLVIRLADVFPDSSHVALHGLERADDIDIWHFAQQHAFTIITKDSDMNDITALHGAPPKIIWLRIGNCSTSVTEMIIRRNQAMIEQFHRDPNGAILEIVLQ
jgi:predicted nuclease of predicted toxin-antitoxin system